MDNFDEQLEHDIEVLQKKYKIAWSNDQVRQDAIKLISGDDKKKHNYRKLFRRLAEDISKDYGHIFEENEIIKERPAGAEKIMSVTCRIETKGKYIKRNRYVITKVEIGDHHISRTRILRRY